MILKVLANPLEVMNNRNIQGCQMVRIADA